MRQLLFFALCQFFYFLLLFLGGLQEQQILSNRDETSSHECLMHITLRLKFLLH